MKTNIQALVPPARVNITVDVETNGAKRKKELPLKLLVLGDFSGSPQSEPLELRQRVPIHKDNFDAVVDIINPKLTFSVSNEIYPAQGDLSVQLEMHQLQDFHPESIVAQVPELSQLIAMRNLLKELRANLLDKHAFRRELEKILKNSDRREQLNQELEVLAPLKK